MQQRQNHFVAQLANQLQTANVRFIGPACVALLLAWATLFGVDGNPVIRRMMAFPQSDKVGHLVLYAALTAAVVWTLGDRRIHRLGSLPAWPTAIFGIGLVDEARQIGLDDRSFEVADLAANSLGIWAGWVLAVWFLLKRL